MLRRSSRKCLSRYGSAARCRGGAFRRRVDRTRKTAELYSPRESRRTKVLSLSDEGSAKRRCKKGLSLHKVVWTAPRISAHFILRRPDFSLSLSFLLLPRRLRVIRFVNDSRLSCRLITLLSFSSSSFSLLPMIFLSLFFDSSLPKVRIRKRRRRRGREEG